MHSIFDNLLMEIAEIVHFRLIAILCYISDKNVIYTRKLMIAKECSENKFLIIDIVRFEVIVL